jgi:glycosyltransferase involved in cell wall biosynthesis
MTSVSFVVPVYNKSKFLKPVIKSIKSQKGKFKKEYIFIDDGSTDDSYRILKQETKGMKDCQIIKQENKGSANATNQGIKTAKMKYIKFLDADDLILSDSTKLLVDILEKNSSCILAFGLQRKVENIVNVDLNERINNYEIEMIENPLKLAMRNSMFNPSQFLVRTSFCKNVGGCDERIRFSQEYSLTLRLSKIGSFVKLNYPIAILPYSAPGQISEKKNNQIYRVSKALELFINENNDLSLKTKLYAQRRLTARAWRFARNNKIKDLYLKYFILYLIGLLRINIKPLKVCKQANKIYEPFLD